MATQADILAALSTIIDPESGKDIVSLGLVDDVRTDGANVSFNLLLPASDSSQREAMRRQAESAVGSLPGVEAVAVHLAAPGQAAPGPARPDSKIANIIAVASGKGGVGKSTTAVNLAVAMAQSGARVGLFDADIHGPSIPRLMGLNGIRPEVGADNTLIPLENHGVRVMSIGFMMEEGRALVWRGQMVGSAITQMLDDVVWGELDYLIVDMPPGTGDAQLALTQAVPVTAAVMVTTPQGLALMDCRRGIAMFREIHVPTLGIVENMSQFICPHCGERSAIFDEGGAARLSEEFRTEVLAHVPLDIRIRELADAGKPVVAALPDSEQAAIYRTLAAEVARRVGIIRRRRIDIPVIVQQA